MRIRLLAVGRRPPRWAEAAFAEYARRLPAALKLESAFIAPGRGSDADRAKGEECDRLLGALAAGDLAVALDERGEAWTTRDLAGRLRRWQAEGRDVAFLVGGAAGLAPKCLERADLHWSLSALTLPHALVRVLLAEQVYRAVSINAGHPYHRD